MGSTMRKLERRMGAGVLANCLGGATAVFALAVLVLSASIDVGAQSPSSSAKTIWDGIYTQGQSERGRTIFVASCGRCHNDELAGSERGPALRDDAFWQRWDNDSFDKLFTKVRDTMPQQGVDSLSDTQWVRTFTHPEVGLTRLDQLVALYSWHGRHHIAQVTSLRQRMGW